MDLKLQIRDTIKRYRMFGKGDRILVAVSGGPDSVFLLHALNALKSSLGIKLYIAHMDHGTRGVESKRDAEFVKKLAKGMGTRLIFKKFVKRREKSKLSPEEILREARYDFFKKASKKVKAPIVATAHTLDDQVETVLMRILKGTSLKGLVGVHPVRVEGPVRFVRPLIETEKREVVGYMKDKKIPFRIDCTNFEDKFLRNRVRNKVIPYLEKINPRLKRSLFNLAESLKEDFDFIEEEKKKRKSLIKSKTLPLYIELYEVLLQPRALRKEIMREAFKIAGGNIKKLTYRHWQDIDDFILVKEKGKSMDLPGGIKIRKVRERLIFAS